MMIIEKPYISDFLKQTIINHQLSVLSSDIAIALIGREGINYIDEQDAIMRFKQQEFLIYTPSENAIGWIQEQLGYSGLSKKVSLFKDKFAFRELTQSMCSDLFYQKVGLDELQTIEISELPESFIVKPNTGFFSMGVYRTGRYNWDEVKVNINRDIKLHADLYPVTVLDTSLFIIEEIIVGDEYAIDAYYDKHGKAHIVGMMKHVFASDDDMSDRLYMTSRPIVLEMLDGFQLFLDELGRIFNLTQFPLHVEVRVNKQKEVFPIEVNPLRFGAWCTSADLMHHAYGINSIATVVNGGIVEWKRLLEGKDDSIYSIIILDNSNTGVAKEDIETFNYDMLLKQFANPLELRKVDFKRYPQFAFLFTKTNPENYTELERILNDDLKSYLSLTTHNSPLKTDTC